MWECWFCGAPSASAETAAIAEMCKDVHQVGNMRYWSTRTATIPRCSRCQRSHQRARHAIIGGGVAFVAAVSIKYAPQPPDAGRLVVLFMASLLVYWPFSWIAARAYFALKHIQPPTYGATHENIKALETDGWRVGSGSMGWDYWFNSLAGHIR